MAWAPLVAAGAQIVAGQDAARKQAAALAEAQSKRDAAADRVYGIDAPDLADVQYSPETAAYVGDVNPTLQTQLGNLTSASEGIQGDPRFKTAQYQSLGALDDIANNGGLTALDKLNFQNAQNDSSAQASREQAKILQDQAERGMGGSGAELAARLASSQGAANRNAAAAQTQAATAQQRALDAILQRGNLGTSMQSADYAQQNTAAAAKDLIAKFNQQNAYNVQGANQTAQNVAATNNQGAQQAAANNTANTLNAAKQYNANANNTVFNNALNQANAGVAAANGQAISREASGQAAANQGAAIVGAIPGVVKAGTDAYQNYSKSSDQPAASTNAGTYAGQNDDENKYA